MSNINMNTLQAIGEEVTEAAEFLQKKFPKMPLDVTYQLAAMARQERGQANMYKKEREVAEYSANQLCSIFNKLCELTDLQCTSTELTRTISRELRR